MPMRLPDNQPSDAMYKWNEAIEFPEESDHLAMVYSIGRIAPPGIPSGLPRHATVLVSTIASGSRARLSRRGRTMRRYYSS